jgi:NAD(P)H-hydrate epimerase
LRCSSRRLGNAQATEWPTTASQIKAEITSWADAAVLGPGLGKSDKTRDLIEKVLTGSKVPVLLDADALNVFEGDTKSLGALLRGRPALVTPHVAEFGRLASVDPKEVLANRFDIGIDLARTLNCTVLLKGSPTVVFSPDGNRYVIPRGTAALGTGGSGDMLSGITGTILAQTSDATAAACCAAWVHGRAAELCEYVRGTTLEDVLFALPRAWNESEPEPEPPIMTVIPGVQR